MQAISLLTLILHTCKDNKKGKYFKTRCGLTFTRCAIMHTMLQNITCLLRALFELKTKMVRNVKDGFFQTFYHFFIIIIHTQEKKLR